MLLAVSKTATGCLFKMKNLFDLSNQVALVLGAGQTGQVLASALSELGARTLLSDQEERLEATEYTHRIPVQPEQAQSISDLAEEILSRHGRVDILINAWEPFRCQEATEISPEDWKALVRDPIKSAFFSCQTFGSIMLRQGSGSIINFSSVAGSLGFARALAFSTCKGGMDQLTRTLGAEWGSRGVRVNGIAGWSDALRSLQDRPWEKRIPTGTIPPYSDLAGAAVYLASPASRSVTGQILFVDGGYSAQ
jgi:NAD(P)-dependent dehydrogenase (short-subunit alcohol dehydrogenase family)